MSGRPQPGTDRPGQDPQRDAQRPPPWRGLVVVVGPSLLAVVYALVGTLSAIAYLLYLRLTARLFGHANEVEVFPDTEEPDLLAEVRVRADVTRIGHQVGQYVPRRVPPLELG